MVRKRFDVQEELQGRVTIYTFVIIMVFATLMGRLWYMQVLSATEYKKLADNNRLREITVEAIRGDVYDRKGRMMVTSRPSVCITAVPYIIDKNPESKKRFIELSKVSSKEINMRLRTKKEDPLKPKVIIRDADEKLVYYIKEHSDEFPGIKVEEIPVRHYPNGSIASHLLGYVGEVSDIQLAKDVFRDVQLGDLVGKDGVEYQNNSTLMGVKGKQVLETNSKGRPTRILKSVKPIAGSNLLLTIDKDIQEATESALDKAVKAARSQFDSETKKRFLGTAGAAVVMDPRNGDILAMASAPAYDPSKFIGGIKQVEWDALNDPAAHAPMNNRAYVSLYPPASTSKPFTAFAALEEKLITTNDSFSCGGDWRRWNQTFRCWDKTGHGNVSLVRALAESCDVYFYNVGAILYNSPKHQNESIQFWSQKFGFGKKTGVNLPNEGGVKDSQKETGRVPTKKWKAIFNRLNDRKYQIWYPGDTINMSIGQGDLLVTPLQLANAYAAIANGGTLYRPQVVKEIRSPKGKTIKRMKPEINAKIDVQTWTLDAIRQGLKSVVAGKGTAAAAFAGFGVPVAGKTGTAQVKGKQDTALFVGYAPADNPKYVVAVIIEEGGNGSSVAAPAVRDIMSAIFYKKQTGIKVVEAAD